MATQCLICCNGTGESLTIREPLSGNGHGVRSWKEELLEGFCMLFGIAGDHPKVATLFEDADKDFVRRLCKECLEDVGRVHDVLWLLKNLENRLNQLQDLLSGKLKQNVEARRRTCSSGVVKVEEGYTGGDLEGDDDVAKALYEEIQASIWPTGSWKMEWSQRCRTAMEFDRVGDTTLDVGMEDENNAEEMHDTYLDVEVEREAGPNWELESKSSVDSDEEWSRKQNFKKGQRNIRSKSRKVSGKRTLLCTYDPDICNRTYSSQDDLSHHIKNFHKGRTHVCDYTGCKEKFLKPSTLVRHKVKAHGMEKKKILRCKINPVVCSLVFFQEDDLAAHIQEVHNGEVAATPQFLCTVDLDICDRAYFRKDDLLHHIKKFHEARTHVCDHTGCKEKFLKESSLVSHKVKAHGLDLKTKKKLTPGTNSKIKIDKVKKQTGRNRKSRPSEKIKMVCELCGISVLKESYKKHVKRHQLDPDKDKVACELCSMRFSTSNQLLSHQSLHNSATLPFMCVVVPCDQILSNSLELRKHVIREHLPDWLKCKVCGEVKPTEHLLREHEKKHSEKNIRICEICAKTFVNSSGYCAHKRKCHGEGIKMYTCHTCGKGFAVKGGLTRHLSSHLVEKPFKCGICGKTFATSNALQRHEAIHSGTKNFECKVCDKRFKQGDNFRQHCRTQAHVKKVQFTQEPVKHEGWEREEYGQYGDSSYQ